MEEKPNYFAIIPANVRYDTDLKAIEKLLYGEITSLTQKTGECWANNNYFANLYSVYPTTISKYLNHLKEKGYIQIKMQYADNSKKIEKRVIGIAQTDNTYCSNEQGGIAQTSKDNNTSINNTSINNKEIYKESWDCDAYVKNVADAEIGYLNELTGRNYRVDNPKSISLIRARLKEGFKVIDIMRVIETKCDEWLDTDMEKYLRPETLFGSKFENYVNQRRRK